MTSHSEKEQAAPTYKGGFGLHPLLGFLANTGETMSGRLRPGNSGANTAADHIAVLDDALAQIPDTHRYRTQILVRADSAGSAKAFLTHIRTLRCPHPSPIQRRSPTSTYVDTNDSAASCTSTNMRVTSKDGVYGKRNADGRGIEDVVAAQRRQPGHLFRGRWNTRQARQFGTGRHRRRNTWRRGDRGNHAS
ncbi:transposase [Streptomyces sp. NPDC056704]|uniref:transposase n=1 Tax=Streptomyces sp. NPDC056704 TaxID=3345917 RepID=UPI00367CA4BF